MCDVINSEIFRQFNETKVETNTLHFLATLRCSLNENERQNATVLNAMRDTKYRCRHKMLRKSNVNLFSIYKI